MSAGRGWLLLALLLGACSKNQAPEPRREPPSCDCAPSERVVDPTLLAFLSQARSAHHIADQHEEAADVAAAVRALESLAAAPKPAGAAPEVEEVLADTRARLAELLSRLGNYDDADAAVSAGLVNAPAPSYFRGHLFEVRGLVEERRAKALRSKGRGPEADQARQRSLAAYEEALQIQGQFIEKSIDPAARKAPPATPSPK